MQDTAPPTPHATPPHASFLQKLGPGGFATLMLAFASGLITLGIPLLLHRRRVLAAALGMCFASRMQSWYWVGDWKEISLRTSS